MEREGYKAVGEPKWFNNRQTNTNEYPNGSFVQMMEHIQMSRDEQAGDALYTFQV